MNMSRAVSSIVSQFGLYRVGLPFDDKPEIVVQNILTTETIPTYSQFVPWQREETINLRETKLIDKQRNIYLLPDTMTEPPIMDVIDVRMPIDVNRGMYGDIATPFGVSRTLQGVIAHNAYSMAVSQARSEPTFEYLGENKLRLYGFPRAWVIVNVATEHMENGETIPPTCYDSFMQLAKLDIKIFLYNNLKLYDGIPSAFGTISLKIDDYSGAEADRSALLEQWRDLFHLDMPYNFKFL